MLKRRKDQCRTDAASAKSFQHHHVVNAGHARPDEEGRFAYGFAIKSRGKMPNLLWRHACQGVPAFMPTSTPFSRQGLQRRRLVIGELSQAA